MKKKTKIVIGFFAFAVFAVVCGILFGKPENEITSEKEKEVSAEISQEAEAEDKEKATTIDSNKSIEIIWKDDDNMGIVNLELDGNKVKESIINDYYIGVAEYLNALDKDSLKDYEYIQFVGNVMREGKIECTIKGNMNIQAIKDYDKDFDYMLAENNIYDLFIPKPLK